MINKVVSFSVAALFMASVANLGFAAEPEKAGSLKTPSIEGTYKLLSRKLPDGKVLSSPDIVALITYTQTHRNFNIAWRDSAGQYRSYSVVSSYKLTSTEYTETAQLIISNIDDSGDKGITYSMTGSTQTVPVTINDGRIEFKMPFDPVTAVFAGDKFIGIRDGVFVDTYEKVR